jgi:hypothetical protein
MPDTSETFGRGRGFGSEKRRELRSRFEVGERFWRRWAMFVVVRRPRGCQWRLECLDLRFVKSELVPPEKHHGLGALALFFGRGHDDGGNEAWIKVHFE